MKKHILVVSQYFYPEDFSVNEMAKGLVDRGYSVDVVTGMPNYPGGTIFKGYESKLIENWNGIRIHRTPIRPRYQGSFNLFRNYMSFMFKGKNTIRNLKKKYDFVFCYMTSPIFQLTPALFAKKKFNCRLILFYGDQWPESLKARGLSKGIIFDLVLLYCRKVLNKCDHIINVAPHFVDYNHAVNKVPLDKMSWCIQPSTDMFATISTKKDCNTDTVDLLFAGNIGKVQNVEDIILAYNELKYPNLRIHIFGEGSAFEDCQNLIKKNNLQKNIIMYGRVSKNQLVQYFHKMDACLLTLSGKTQIGNTIPSKFAFYLSSGKPILAAINGDTQSIIKQIGCGVCTDADDYKKLAKLIDAYCSNKDKYNNMGNIGRAFFEENCTLTHFLNVFETEMEEIHI